jgi:RNA polymerase sigma-70 factor (ECF subfamily)
LSNQRQIKKLTANMAIEKTTREQEILFKERTGENLDFFYNKFYPRLVYNLNGITNDEHLAEDLATEAFIKAFEKVEQYEKGKAQFSTWLFTIGRHLALQELKQSRRTMSIDVDLDDEGTTLKDFIQEEEDNDEFMHTLNLKKAEILKKYIAELKQPYRMVIEMREIQKMQYKDIAEALDRNLSTVKSQIRNARALLIKASEKEFHLLDEMFLD